MKRVLYLPPRVLTLSAEITEGIGIFCQRHGFWEFHIPGPANWPYNKVIENWQGDGIISQVVNEEAANRLRKTGCPFVNLSAYRETPTVTNDNWAIGKIGAEYLMSKRFPFFAFVGWRDAILTGERWHGFRQTLETQGHVPTYLEVAGESAGVQTELFEQLKSLPSPVAVMACDDFLAHEISVVSGLMGLGPDPSRFALLGVNNSPEAQLNSPPLSSIRLDGKKIGYAAAEMLDFLMREPAPASPPVRRFQPLGIIERASTAQYGFDDPPISRVLERIRTQAMNGINIESLLGDIPLSRRTFERRFKQATGRTPWEEIRRVQIAHVKYLLEETNWSTKKIALSSAFKTASRLAAVFKEETGIAPLEHRKMHRL